MLIRVTVRIIVQTFYTPVRSLQGDVVETTDGQSGVRVGGGDEAFLCSITVSKWAGLCIGMVGAYLSTSSGSISPLAPSAAIPG